jgi:hypothetical protein
MSVNNIFTRFLGLSATAVVLTTISNPAQAVTFKFQNIFPTNSNSELSGDPFVNSFSFEVTESGNNQLLFQFINSSTQGTIGNVHLENTNNLLSNMILNVGNIGNVNFKNIGSGNLPQGNKIGFNNIFAARFNGSGAKRVNSGESLGVKFTGNYNLVISALQTENLRVGIHVQELPGGQSDVFVSEGSTKVPEPISALGTYTALGFGFLWRIKSINMRKKSFVN